MVGEAATTTPVKAKSKHKSFSARAKRRTEPLAIFGANGVVIEYAFLCSIPLWVFFESFRHQFDRSVNYDIQPYQSNTIVQRALSPKVEHRGAGNYVGAEQISNR